jgi:hypothetical protein
MEARLDAEEAAKDAADDAALALPAEDEALVNEAPSDRAPEPPTVQTEPDPGEAPAARPGGAAGGA